MTGNLRAHEKVWANCQACDLCKTRKQVVLYRGDVPAEVCFIGEAPGLSENAIGKPFVGPAGQYLEEVLAKSSPPPYAITNAVCCLPRDASGNVRKPTDQEIKACRRRLEEFLVLCSPRLIITLGSEAKKACKGLSYSQYPLPHPSYVLRKNDSLVYKRFELSLGRALECLE